MNSQINNFLKISAAVLVTVSIVNCGGSGGDGTTTTTDSAPTPETTDTFSDATLTAVVETNALIAHLMVIQIQ